jgi:hypothetical protein
MMEYWFKNLKTKFQKIDVLKSCVKIVVALVIFAGGLLIIRICGEKRLQRFLDMTLLEKRYAKNTVVPQDSPPAIDTNNATSE